MALELDAGQRSARIVVGRDADDDAGIGVALGALVLAHAVGDHAPRLGCRRHHGAARAHAEAVDRTAVAAVVHDLVVGGAQQLVAGKLAEAAAVDHALRMFDAKAQRERLGLHEHAASVQHLEGIARAVADRQDHLLARQIVAIGQLQSAHAAAFDVDIVDARVETDLAPEREDLRTDVLDHLNQPERADVRPRLEQDVLRRAGLDELVQYLAAVVLRVLDLAVELAVGEGTGTALAELHVRFRIQHALAP